jgi:hypothetical protein
VAKEQQCTVEVMLNGRTHLVVVSGGSSPAFGFEHAAGPPPEPTLLRLRCDICAAVARLPFVPPSRSWRRPFVVSRVTHTADG